MVAEPGPERAERPRQPAYPATGFRATAAQPLFGQDRRRRATSGKRRSAGTKIQKKIEKTAKGK